MTLWGGKGVLIKNKGKLQSVPLKIGFTWILPLEVGKIGFYTLKFSYIS